MGGKLTAKERKAMPQLVWDCIQYNLEEKEAQQYINSRLGRDTTGTITGGKERGISLGAYYYYKRVIKRGDFTQEWLNEFTKIGYLVSHHELISTAQEQYRDIVKRLFIEENKTIIDQNGVVRENRDEYKIMRLREDLRQQGTYIMRLNDTTPIVAQVRQILLEKQNQSEQLSTQHGTDAEPESDTGIPPIE
jgi:hypothetical protein